ncbi:hypothetical protein AGR9A_Cc70282 [Agrobacterium salinitolerans str. Hayward 0363]|nr:hypothetical protein AGR9A_Cc70282 [Agrobacterium salinitolerans str. Hayward 0363]
MMRGKSAAQVMGLFVNRRRARAGAAIAEHRALQFVQRIHHAGNGIGIDAIAADRHMHDGEAKLLGTLGNIGEKRLAFFFAVRAVADERLEAERLDLVEIGDADLSRYRIFVVNAPDIHVMPPLAVTLEIRIRCKRSKPRRQ